MWQYEKKLQYPVKIANPNPALAKVIISQLGGPDGSLVQRFAISISVTQPPVVRCRQYSTISAQKNLPTSK